MEEQKSGQESGKQGQKPHKRRKRYSGTHPKKYEEKYIVCIVDFYIYCM